MTEKELTPDEVIDELGGCGRFQWRINVIAHLMKTIICFSITGLIFISATPKWRCVDNNVCTNDTFMKYSNDSDSFCPPKTCTIGNNSCQNIQFEDGLKTMVTDFELVCDRDFIPSTTQSIQISGALVGNLISGQLGELFGRKRPFFFAIVITMIFNVAGFFANNWILYAVCRFFMGLGEGFFMTIKYALLSEFSLANWRAWIIGFPSWPIQSCLLALCAWLIKDWRYLQLMTAALGIPCLVAWWWIPESFRWHVAHDRQDVAEGIIQHVAKVNKKTLTSTKNVLRKPETEKKDKKHSVLDLFGSRKLIVVSLLSALNWVALGLVSYGISFGIQSLSGNIFFNLFLFSLVAIPSKGIAVWLQNRFGRRQTAVICFITVAVGGFGVGGVQTADAPHKDMLTNIFALIANIGISTAWGPVQTMTIEMYPTVIRTIGFGTLSVCGRVAGMAGPQLVYLDSYYPGIMYHVIGAIGVLCALGSLKLPETMDKDLSDKIVKVNKVSPSPQRKNIIRLQ
ncbi:organic cation/carnitine transporter 2-like [Mya arenaria]|uniref:organic cation/carnitine transporter 2-like n=1 Tax=Mya arenaria TaxID=6604 RepID=UPI0022E95A38|nr:organic cation/carnitine transporter 2-like [Mya arenaria]